MSSWIRLPKEDWILIHETCRIAVTWHHLGWYSMWAKLTSIFMPVYDTIRVKWDRWNDNSIRIERWFIKLIHIYIYMYTYTYKQDSCNTDGIEYEPYWLQFSCSLTHWGRDKMVVISQTTFSNAFYWMKMYEFRLRFHWSLFLNVQLTIFHHWFR